jgi:hypothetical protein
MSENQIWLRPLGLQPVEFFGIVGAVSEDVAVPSLVPNVFHPQVAGLLGRSHCSYVPGLKIYIIASVL